MTGRKRDILKIVFIYDQYYLPVLQLLMFYKPELEERQICNICKLSDLGKLESLVLATQYFQFPFFFYNMLSALTRRLCIMFNLLKS